MANIMRRYARATISSNLKSDESHFDTDVLQAVAWSSSEFGAMLLRVRYANDMSSVPRLQSGWLAYVQAQAKAKGWPEYVKPVPVADLSLRYWQNDLCPVCGGKGVKKMEFVEILSDDPCDSCEGTGKKPIECARQIKQWVEEMVTVLEQKTISAGGEAMRLLAREMVF